MGATEQCVLLNMADSSSSEQEVSQHQRGKRSGREKSCDQVTDLNKRWGSGKVRTRTMVDSSMEVLLCSPFYKGASRIHS